MELDGRLRDKLIGTLRTVLPQIALTDKGRLDIRTVFEADRIFSVALRGASKETKELIEEYVGERPFSSLVLGALHDELIALPAQSKDGKRILCEVPQYSDVAALADRLCSLLVTLPNQYVVVLKLPSSISDELFRTKASPILGRRLAVIGSWHGPQEGYPSPPLDEPETTKPLNRLIGLLGIPALATAGPEGQLDAIEQGAKPVSHLYIGVEGYLHSIFSSAPLDRFTTVFKAFFGLALGMELLEDKWKGFGIGLSRCQVFEKRDSGFVKGDDETLGDSASALLSRIQVNENSRERLAQGLHTILQVLDMNDSLPQLALAGRWLFDSRGNSDALMGFMQMAICAEVLLGTEDGAEGVTAILATRCAYLIAKTVKERDDLEKEFKNIYKIRSKIVHRGLGRLKENERQQFQRLRGICNRVIQKEIQLAIGDTPESQRVARLAEVLRSATLSR